MSQQGRAGFQRGRRDAGLEAVLAGRRGVAGPDVNSAQRRDGGQTGLAEYLPGGAGQLVRILAAHFAHGKAVRPGEHRFEVEIGGQGELVGQLEGEESGAGIGETQRGPAPANSCFTAPSAPT